MVPSQYVTKYFLNHLDWQMTFETRHGSKISGLWEAKVGGSRALASQE